MPHPYRELPTIMIALALIVLLASVARTQEGPPGITEPRVLSAFDPTSADCTPPEGLARALAFARDNSRDFMKGVDRGLAMAASERGLEYSVSDAGNDHVEMMEQLREIRSNNAGAIVVAPVDALAVAPALQELIWDGRYVGTIVPPPATSILNAPQYLTGKALGDAAAAYIQEKLNGKAKVALLTHDSLEFLAPRFAAMRDSLRRLPEVTIVADITPMTVDNQGGYSTMNTILLAEPNIDVVLGADTVVLGALAAARDAGKARPDQFFGGIDGEPAAVQELRTPGSPYKTSISLASPIFGYAMGQHAADWLEGKSIPQAMDILPIALDAESLPRYEADLANPAGVFADVERQRLYLRMYGNICYDTRDQYINFPWSSESL